jgi:ubiquinone/menaquinone biosynthesis C-methylase UbiE
VLFPLDVKAEFGSLFDRFWDSEDQAAVYDKFVEGGNSMNDMHHHIGEMNATMEVLGDLGDVRLLDCGCGNGRFLERFPDTVQGFGIDASLNLLRIVKQKGRCKHLVCCELEHLPFVDGSFDVSVSVRVLQHLQKQRDAVAEMVRVLSSGGRSVIHCYNQLSTKALAKHIRMSPRWQPILNAPFQKLHEGLSPFAPWGLEYDCYNTVTQISRWLDESGVFVEQVRGTGFGFNKWFLDGFLIAPRLERDHPEWLRRYLDLSMKLEDVLGRLSPFNRVMEKFVVGGRKR